MVRRAACLGSVWPGDRSTRANESDLDSALVLVYFRHLDLQYLNTTVDSRCTEMAVLFMSTIGCLVRTINVIQKSSYLLALSILSMMLSRDTRQDLHVFILYGTLQGGN